MNSYKYSLIHFYEGKHFNGRKRHVQCSIKAVLEAKLDIHYAFYCILTTLGHSQSNNITIMAQTYSKQINIMFYVFPSVPYINRWFSSKVPHYPNG